MNYRYIFMEKFNNKIEKHLELSEITDMLKEYREDYNVYRRLLIIHMVANGESIAKASKNINISRKLVNDGLDSIMKMVLMVYFQIIPIVEGNLT